MNRMDWNIPDLNTAETCSTYNEIMVMMNAAGAANRRADIEVAKLNIRKHPSTVKKALWVPAKPNLSKLAKPRYAPYAPKGKKQVAATKVSSTDKYPFRSSFLQPSMALGVLDAKQKPVQPSKQVTRPKLCLAPLESLSDDDIKAARTAKSRTVATDEATEEIKHLLEMLANPPVAPTPKSTWFGSIFG